MRATNGYLPSPLLHPAGSLTGAAIRDAARDYVVAGEPLTTFLGDLEAAFEVLELPPPSTEVVKLASIAWADEFLGTLEDLACADPLTGMSSAEHARAHLRTLYRAGDEQYVAEVLDTRALVIVSVFQAYPQPRSDALETAFEESLRLATIAETIRTTFERCDVVAALDYGRVLAVIARDELLHQRTDELAWVLRRRLPVSSAPRVLVDSMPDCENSACALLDDLSV